MLLDPAKDASLQKAIKASRVMTVHQTHGAAHYGTIGFEKTVTGQVLIFPKSLKKFEGARVVGVKYELFDDSPVPKSQRYPPPKPARAAKPKPTSNVAKAKSRSEEKRAPASDKVVPFPHPSPKEDDDDEVDTAELKAGIRRALHLLEQGKQVAAFNFLKRLVT